MLGRGLSIWDFYLYFPELYSIMVGLEFFEKEGIPC